MRDRAAVDVDDRGIPAEVLVDRERLGGERLIGFDKIEVLDRPACLFQRLADGGNRAGAHDRGSTPAVAQETMRAIGVSPRRLASAALMTTNAAAPSLRPEALAAVTDPSLEKAGFSFAIAS